MIVGIHTLENKTFIGKVLLMSGLRTKMWSIALATLFAWVTTAYGDTISNNYLCLPTQNDNNCSSSLLSLTGDKYPTVNFTTVGVTRQSFREFMNSMREHVESGQPFHQIMTLRDPSYVTMSDRFVLVNLSNWADTPITLAIDVTNLYVVGYRSEDQSYFFPDAPPTSTLFTETTHNVLPFGSSYPDLEREAGSRNNIYLGMGELEESIQDLYYYRRGNLARSFIVVIQMISESVRFRYIENQILLNTITDDTSSFLPTGTMLNLENSWQSLSSRIQQSVEGRFPSINLVNRYGDQVPVNSVTPGLVLNIAIMIFVCNNPNQPSQRSSPAFSTLSTMPMVGSDDQHTCTDTPEPTVRIKGRNNLCVDVKDGFFNDGDPIILWPCKSSEDKNQLWTLKMDDTILSNGMCMTVTSSKRVVIYTCNKVVPSGATKWQIWDNGTIINPDTGLVLTATAGATNTELVMDTDSCTSGQGWIASNDTDPEVTPIVGYKDLCLQAQYGNYVWLQDCVSEQLSQQWAVYPDGTIRPNGNKDNCLTWESYPQGQDVAIDPCDGGAGQRWLFKNDGTISNLYTKLVLDVKQSDPSLHKIIVWTYHGGENQMWYSWLI